MIQATIFDLLEKPNPEPLPPHNGVPTSKAAAESVRDHVNRLRAVVLDAIRSAGERGMTCDEVEVATEIRHQTSSARICELANAGWITEARSAGSEVVKRPTRSGRKAIVWIAT